MQIALRAKRPTPTANEAVDALQWSVELTPLSASASYAGFPLPLREIEGTIRIASTRVEMNLRGRQLEAPIRVVGKFRESKTAKPGTDDWLSELSIESDRLAINEELGRALATCSPDTQEAWSTLSPSSGQCDVTFALWSPQGGGEGFDFDGRFDLSGATIDPNMFPVQVQELGGTLLVQGNTANGQATADLDHWRGKMIGLAGADDAELMVVGAVDVDSEGTRESVTTVVRDLELNDGLADVLVQEDLLPRAAWDTLDPSGAIDLIVHSTKYGSGPMGHELSVFLRGVESRAPILPTPATEVRGEIRVIDGDVSFRDLTAVISDSLVEIHEGTVRFTNGAQGPDTARDDSRVLFDVELSADAFPIDERLGRVLPSPLREVWMARHARGQARVRRLHLTVDMPGSAPDDETFFAGIKTTLRGQIEPLGVSLFLGTRIDGINGVLRIDDGDLSSNTNILNGRLQDAVFRILGHEVTGLTGTVSAGADAFRLSTFSAAVHEGVIEGRNASAFTYTYPTLEGGKTTPGKLQTDISFRGISLSHLLADLGDGDAPYRGSIAGHLVVDELTDEELVSARASGHIEIRDGNLGEVPLFEAIYASMPQANRPRFTELSLDFAMGDGAIDLQDLVVRANRTAVRGSGSLSMGGYLDMVMNVESLFGDSADALLLPKVIHEITSRVVTFYVYGYVRDLQTKVQWIFGAKPDRPPLGPITPPREPLPPKRF